MWRRELAALWKLASLQMQIHLLETEAREDLERKGERAVGLFACGRVGSLAQSTQVTIHIYLGTAHCLEVCVSYREAR